MNKPRSILKRARTIRLHQVLPLVMIGLVAGQDTIAETRRALIVGINDYASGGTGDGGRGRWTNLGGSINDVEGLREILISKYGFARENITTLINKEATRKNILSAYNDRLVRPVQKGDICLFYYAGHGSQVVNSKSNERDGKDETIVPADSNRGEWDIRDKELAYMFNDTLDKEARLTVLFDSCHSGSIARGTTPGLARSIAPDTRDIAQIVKDEKPDPRGPPEARKNGALILSAAQDHQLAYEAIDSGGRPHGSFSLALQRALLAGPSQSASAIYKRTRGLMQADGINQDPVLAGPVDRFAQPLFGGDSDDAIGGTTVAVLKTLAKGYVVLEGGRAVGLNVGCELVKVGEEDIRIEIEGLDGLNGATAKIKKGRSSSVLKGDLFKLDKWTAPDEAHLQAWITGPLAFDDIVATAKAMKPLAADKSITWVQNPTEQKPTHELLWTGKEWRLDGPGGHSTVMGSSPTADAVMADIKRTGGNARFFINLPPTPELVKAIALNKVDPTSSVVSAKAIEQAHYVLFGRINNGLPEYAWVHPAATLEGREVSTLPPRGDWLEVGKGPASANDVGTDLWNHVKSLGRIRAWITLDGPPDGAEFPYDLRLKRRSTGQILASGNITEEDSYQLVLVLRNADSRRPVQKRFAYVFVLDSCGNSSLLFPPLGQGNVENTVPLVVSRTPDKEILLGEPFLIGPPYGVDTYVLLTSKETIPDPDRVLHAQGVRTRGASSEDGLSALLTGIGGTTRGVRQATPTTWSIDRLTFVSKEK